MQYDAECKSHLDNWSEFGNIDWNLLNEALLDDETSGHDGFSPTDQQEPNTPTSRDTIPKSTDRKFSGEESKIKTSTKRKRDNLHDHIKALEEQNKIMRRALAEYNITPDQLILKRNTRLATFQRLIEIFNSGDVMQLTNFLIHTTTPDSLLLTPSLFQELHGRNAVIQFWTLILEAFPDGLFQLSETSYEENGFVATRFTFTGTKVSALPSDVLLHRWGRFRDMMATMRAGVQSGIRPPTQETQAATFRDLCTNDMVPTTSGPFVPRGLPNEAAGISERNQGMDFLPHHYAAAAAAAAAAASSTSVPLQVKTERMSPAQDTPLSFPSSLPSPSSSSHGSLPFPPPPFPSTSTSGIAPSSVPLSIGVPTMRLTGYMTVTFNSCNLINRYIFVWNTASLIGQILGLSNGDLEAMSQYFNAPTSPSASS